ncbi:unnamed protein product [Schistosoma mattheei]|uniref:Uncharacterized protein n=2 Tax=Schistosoma mattheei TaxID=31246 RepID=A0A183PR80_9TREM|nr:unnamed protein product [Schistosoma mattheei]
MNTIPVYCNNINTNEAIENEHFIRAFHCFFELFSKPNFNNENKLLYNTKYLSTFESEPPFLQSSTLNSINDDCKTYDNTDITATTTTNNNNNNTINNNDDTNNNERNNSNTNNYINNESCSAYNTHQSLFLSGLQKTFRNHFIIPQYASYMKWEKFNDVLKMEENTNEIPLDLSVSSNVYNSLTQSINTTIHTTPHDIGSNIKLREDNNNKQLIVCQLNCEYSQRKEHTNDDSSLNHLHLSYDPSMKRKRSYKRFMNRKNTLVTANDDHISNSNNYWKRKQYTDVDMSKNIAHFIKLNRRSNKLEQSPTVKSSSLSSSITTSLPIVNHIECSPPGKQPVTRCNHCHVLFPSLYELNNHFIKEHSVILQAEMEHTKSWKSHTIDDSCLQNMRILLNRSTNMNMSGYPCPNCDYVAKWPTELQKHIMVHSKQRPHRCIICGLSYKWKWDLGRHFDKSHNRTMNPYKKNVFNHIQNHNNRLKSVNKTSMKTKKLLPAHEKVDDVSKCNYQLTHSMGNPKLLSTSTYIISNQQIEICETLTQDKTIKPIDLTSYTQMDIV